MPGQENLKELHYICPIENVPSIMKHGILSHSQASRVRHRSVADQDVQDLRAGKGVPGGFLLHDYVNLYFNARNPMLFKRRDIVSELCVLRISLEVLAGGGVVLTDGNAASDCTKFGDYWTMLEAIRWDLVFAESWALGDPEERRERKRVICAEILIPKPVAPRSLIGAYVSSEEAYSELIKVAFTLAIEVNPHLFFLS